MSETLTPQTENARNGQAKTMDFPNDPWTRVTIFLKAHGRLPTEDDDRITNSTLSAFCDSFCENYDEKSADLEAIYRAIQRGEVKTTNDLLMPSEVIEPIIKFVKDVKRLSTTRVSLHGNSVSPTK